MRSGDDLWPAACSLQSIALERQQRLHGHHVGNTLGRPARVSRRSARRHCKFFYVRRFVGTTGGADEFVPVTLRLAGNGAQRDLLPQSSLPAEEHGTQHRFTEVKRFNVFLPPGGRTIIPGPDNALIDKTVEGKYLLLLRIEAAQDGLNRSKLSAVGAGPGTIDSGGVAGFAMPALRYYVGTGGDTQADEFNAVENQLAPADQAEFGASQAILFSWPTVPEAKYYRFVVENAAGAEVFSAILLHDARTYRAPSWLLKEANSDLLRWRVLAFDAKDTKLSETSMRTLRWVRE